jgi:hypothetical protein
MKKTFAFCVFCSGLGFFVGGWVGCWWWLVSGYLQVTAYSDDLSPLLNCLKYLTHYELHSITLSCLTPTNARDLIILYLHSIFENER